MGLLERDEALAVLDRASAEAAAGAGRLVLIAGEAGIGKTSLLQAHRAASPLRWLVGGCDGSFTPTPLGPLFDIAAEAGGALDVGCRGGATREELFRLLLDELAAQPTVLVIEDLHWADEATLDLVAFLARRIETLPVLLLCSYRDDGLPSAHPLRTVLGELASRSWARRIDLQPLSVEAVGELAAPSGTDAAQLWQLTGGNPFFVTELLAAGLEEVPRSAQDVMRTRVARLSRPARHALDAAAVLGSAFSISLLAEVAGDDAVAIDECVEAGLVLEDGRLLRFRHEIARRAVAEAIPAHRRLDLHRRTLAALEQQPSADIARLAHHAAAAMDTDAVLRYAPDAARRASQLASHREAASHYRVALEFADRLAPTDLAELHQALAFELSCFDAWEEAVAPGEAALALWQEVGDQRRVGDCQRLLARAMWRLCRGDDTVALTAAALTTLAAIPESVEYGRACQWAAGLADGDEALLLLQTAGRIAESAGDAALLSEVLNSRACRHFNAGETWEPMMRQALAVALDAGAEQQAGRGYANLHAMLSGERRFAAAAEVLSAGMDFCEARDQGTYGLCLRGGEVADLVSVGRWSEALARSDEMLQLPMASPVNRLSVLLAVAGVRSRTADPRAGGIVDQVTRAAAAAGSADYQVEATLCRAEAAWLSGDDAVGLAELSVVSEAEIDPWQRGLIAMWRVRCGGDAEVAGPVAEAYALELAGLYRDAADLWRQLGCPYDEAMALLGSPDAADVRAALPILDRLGAVPAAARGRARLRALGGGPVPRGPRRSTRTDPFGLTAREREVLDLVAEGATNADIAQHLFIAEKTVDHHVSAVIAKTGATSRQDAVSRYRSEGALVPGALVP